MEKHSERRKHYTLAEVRRSHKFLPRHRSLPRGTRRPKFNQLEMVTTFTEKCRDLEIRVRGQSRSSELTWIDPPAMISYWRSIVTMGLSRTVSEIDCDFSRKLQKKFPPPCILRPCWRGSTWIRNNWNDEATRWSTKFQGGFSPLDTILACDIHPATLRQQ